MDTQITNNLIELNHDQYLDVGDAYMQQLTNQWLDIVKTTDISDFDRIDSLKKAVYQLGQKEQRAFWKYNTGLKRLLDRQIRDVQDQEKATQLLQELQSMVLKIKPPKNGFLKGFMNMFKLLFSLSDSAWEMWLESYPINKEHILKITAKLENKKLLLKRDISLLTSDKSELNNHLQILEDSFDMLSILNEKVSYALANNKDMSIDIQNLLTDELLPVKQQRIIDIQQQLLIARQAAMTLDLFISQNESQIRGIDQAIYTTASAMDVTASIFILKQSEITVKTAKIQSNQNNCKTLDKQKLNQARHQIDEALKQLEQAKIESETT